MKIDELKIDRHREQVAEFIRGQSSPHKEILFKELAWDGPDIPVQYDRSLYPREHSAAKKVAMNSLKRFLDSLPALPYDGGAQAQNRPPLTMGVRSWSRPSVQYY